MIAIIAGTGIEKMGLYGNGIQRDVITKYGRATLYETEINGNPVCFLPRHSDDHSIAPHLINHKANIAALKKVGVNHIIATCSVGSLRVDLPPGSIVLINDFISASGGHIDSFYSEPGSPVVHTDLSIPYCPNMRHIIENVCRKQDIELVNSGTYVGVLGPRYETPAEVRAFRIWGGDVVGMTNIPECILAREAGICYAALAIVTNMGTGLDDRGLEHGDVTRAAQTVLPTIEQIIHAVLTDASNISGCSCHTSVQDIL